MIAPWHSAGEVEEISPIVCGTSVFEEVVRAAACFRADPYDDRLVLRGWSTKWFVKILSEF
jgi:hypothetical protein